MKPLLRLGDVTRTFRGVGSPVRALSGLDLELWPGEMVALMGPSGSGKSTALAVAGLLMRPTSGDVEISGEPAPVDERRRAGLRNRYVGYVHQEFAVIQDLSAIANVAIPLEYVRPRMARRVRRKKSRDVLLSLGIPAEVSARRVSTLSGGQRQRVAIARALVNDPCVVLADEPTASLDSETADEIVRVFTQISKSRQRAVLVATHDERVAAACDRVVRMRDGRQLAGAT